MYHFGLVSKVTMNLLEQLSQNESTCKCMIFLILFGLYNVYTSCPAIPRIYVLYTFTILGRGTSIYVFSL